MLPLDSLVSPLYIKSLKLHFYVSCLQRYDHICSNHHIHGGHFKIQDGGHKNEMLECQPIFSIILEVYAYFDIGWHMLPLRVITFNNSHKYIQTTVTKVALGA